MRISEIKKQLEKVKQAGKFCGSSTIRRRNLFLSSLENLLIKNREKILNANQKDISLAQKKSLTQSFIQRLRLTRKSIEEIVRSLDQVRRMRDPIHRLLENRVLGSGIRLRKLAVPIGVLFVIYESRPEVTINTCALSIKSGNTLLLKGGSQAHSTNMVFINLVHKSLARSGLSEDCIYFLDLKDRDKIPFLLSQTNYIDLVIPRGGYSLVSTIVSHSRIPVLYHSAGGARIYVDQSADLDIALKVLINAKTSRPATCNSLDTVLIHSAIADKFLKKLYKEFKKRNVEVFGDKKVSKILEVKKADELLWRKEFLGLQILIGLVDNIDEAIEIIWRYTKNHSEGIIARDEQVIDKFTKNIDAAALFVNCSTRLHDGEEFGLGGEMGISTSRIHARGPVALDELTTYKWIVEGSGQIRR